MKKRLLVLFAVFAMFGPARAQQASHLQNFRLLPEEDVPNELTFALRGKYLAFFIIEDTYFRTYSIGAEAILNERHCLGFDVNVFRWRYQTDDSQDQAMYDDFERRFYLSMDYKLNFMLNDNFGIYANAIYKFAGKFTSWTESYDHPDVNKDNPLYKSTSSGSFFEPGLGAGIKYYFGDSNFGIDASMNVTKMFETRNERNYNEAGEVEYVDGINMDRNRLYIRMNFFYHFGR